MHKSTFIKRTRLPFSAEAVFEWHARPGAFERLVPPWGRVRLVRQTGEMQVGTRLELSLRFGPFCRRWVAEITDFQPGGQFRDIQVAGPFRFWEHTHKMLPDGDDGCVLEDHVEYALPGGLAGRLFGSRIVRRQLERVFRYRHRLIRDDLRVHLESGVKRTMRILVTGSHGLIGSALVPFLKTGGHEVSRLVRSAETAPGEIRWDPEEQSIEKEKLEGFDAVVHLAGENIAGGRWNAERKQRIRDSRVEGTRLLAEALAGLNRPPQVLVCASAVGYYGDRGEEVLDERSESGSGFLAEVCREWEAAAQPARERGIRVVNLRFGMVLSASGGALEKMLLPFKMGVAGIVGNGRQYWSWVALDDVPEAVLYVITNEKLKGGINCTSPRPVTNREFTKTLGRVLRRPTIFPMPGFIARLEFGEMADELMLASTRVLPDKLSESGFEFRFRDVEGALRHTLGRETEAPKEAEG